MSAPSCPHTRTILIAKDEHEEYLECLDCGEIFEVAEREPSSPGFNETLSTPSLHFPSCWPHWREL